MRVQFTVTNQHIEANVPTKIVADSKNYLEASFFFVSQEWEGLPKTVIFSNQIGSYHVLLDDTNTCLVPWECLIAGELSVSIFAGDRITTDVSKIKIFPSGYKLGETPRQPTPDVYAEILNRLKTIQAGTVSEADIREAVRSYLEANPVETLTEDEIARIFMESTEIKSAIQTMLGAYFEENKEDFVGPQGEPGSKGDPGEDGAPGQKGEPGNDGVDGKDFVREVEDLSGSDLSSGVNASAGKVYLLGKCGAVSVNFVSPEDESVENTYVVKFVADTEGIIPVFKYEGDSSYITPKMLSEAKDGDKMKAVFDWSDKLLVVM